MIMLDHGLLPLCCVKRKDTYLDSNVLLWRMKENKPVLDKNSKALEALRRVVIDLRFLKSLHHYVTFRYESLTKLGIEVNLVSYTLQVGIARFEQVTYLVLDRVRTYTGLRRPMVEMSKCITQNYILA